ncbi:TPA: hypothetical protein ACHVI3_002125, partial [Streptococcus suis]
HEYYLSTDLCLSNGNSVLQELFFKQKTIKRYNNNGINIDLIRAINLMTTKEIKGVSQEDFENNININEAVITSGYLAALRLDPVSVCGKEMKNITDIGQFEKHKFHLPIRIYESNPKHNRTSQGHLQGKGTVSVMDLDDAKAQEVLNKSILVGEKCYGYHDGKYYEFQCHEKNCWHGYCPHDDIPENIKSKFKETI